MPRRLPRSAHASWISVLAGCWLTAVVACGADAVLGEQADECASDDECPADQFCNTPIGCSSRRTCGALMCSAAPPRGYCGCDGRVFIDAAQCPSRAHQPYDDAVLAPGDPDRELEGTVCAAAD